MIIYKCTTHFIYSFHLFIFLFYCFHLENWIFRKKNKLLLFIVSKHYLVLSILRTSKSATLLIKMRTRFSYMPVDIDLWSLYETFESHDLKKIRTGPASRWYCDQNPPFCSWDYHKQISNLNITKFKRGKLVIGIWNFKYKLEKNQDF